MMKYKGYIAKVDFDDEANIFHGEVVNTHDVITFEGDCVQDLRQAFTASVEDYLAFCAARNEKPEKPFSGQFVVRVDPLLHQRAALEALQEGISLNQWVSKAMERGLD
jgi:predicted HicB family RNase H-like nuclease